MITLVGFSPYIENYCMVKSAAHDHDKPLRNIEPIKYLIALKDINFIDL